MTTITSIRPTFGPQFNRPQPTPQRSSQAPAAPRRTLLSGPEVQRMLAAPNYREKPEFIAYEQEYKETIDRIKNFAGDNAHRVDPPLSNESINTVRNHFNELKSHITNPNIDFFGAHKEIIYGQGKELFHELGDLLQNEAIPIQKRLNTVRTMAPSMETCSGGVMTALQGALSGLQTAGGVKGAAYRTKLQMMEALISQHVRENHRGYGTGNEVHYANAYFNYLASDMGVPERLDQFTRIAESEISIGQFEKCRQLVLTKLNPNALTKIMAGDYLDQVKGAQRVDVSQPVADNELTDVFRRNQDIQQATLNNEFGEVPQDSFLLPVPDSYSYQFAKQPTLIAKHFIETLKQENLVNYDHAITLSDRNDQGAVKMLGDLFWRDREGACEELSAKELLAIPPEEIEGSLNSQVAEADRGEVFSGIAQHILDSREQENIRSVPDAWLQGFASLYNEGKISRPQIAPVLQLAVHHECLQALGMLLIKGVDTEIRDSHGNTPLMLAARDGKTGSVSQLLQGGAFSTAENNAGEMPLHLCSKNGQAPTVREMLRHEPVYINHQDRSRFTPLMHAAKAGHVETLRALLNYRGPGGFQADLALKDMQGRTATQIAEQEGHAEAARLLARAPREGETLLMACLRDGDNDALQALIDQGENIDAQTPMGKTALMVAAKRGQRQAVDILLQAGANPALLDHREHTALRIAQLEGHPEVVQVLSRAMPKAGETILMTLARNGNTRGLERRVAQGDDINAQNPDGKSALMLAIEQSHSEAIAELLRLGANPNIQDRLRQTPLRIALYDRVPVATVHALLDAGADPNLKPALSPHFLAANSPASLGKLVALIEGGADLTHRVTFMPDYFPITAKGLAKRKGNTAGLKVLEAASIKPRRGENTLMVCARRGHTDALRAFVEHGRMDVNAQNPQGMTAVMLAAAHKHTDTVIALLDAQKADLSLRNHKGQTAEMIAASTGRTDDANILALALENPRPAFLLQHFSREGRLEVVRTLLAHSKLAKDGASVALHSAALNSRPEVVKLLLEHGADPDKTHGTGMTPMIVTALKGDVEVVKALLAGGANPNIQSGGSLDTALTYAARGGHLDVIRVLLDAKADPTLSNMRGLRADQIAENRGDHQAVELLDDALFESWRQTLEAGGDLENHPWELREQELAARAPTARG